MTSQIALISTDAIPLVTDSVAQFDAKAFKFAAALNPFAQQANAVATEAAQNSASAVAASQNALSYSISAQGYRDQAAVSAQLADSAWTNIQSLLWAGSATNMFQGGTFTGPVGFASTVDASSGLFKIGPTKEKIITVNATTATSVIDLSVGDVFLVNVKANTSLSFTNAPADGTLKSFTIITKNDATAGRALAFPAGVLFAGGILPPRSTAANARDVWTFFSDNGTSFVGSLSIQNY